MISLIFLTTALVGEIFVTILLVLGILSPDQRIWPPSPEHPGWRGLMSILFGSISLFLILLGIFEWSQAFFPNWLRLIGGVVWLAGLSLSLMAIDACGKSITLGGTDELVLKGPYCYSRNPQYLGFIISLVGWGTLIGSLPAILGCLGAIPPLIIAPHLEESWLLDQYGTSYSAYQTKISRWFNVRLFKK